MNQIKTILLLTAIIGLILLSSYNTRQERELTHVINKATLTTQTLTNEEINAVINSELTEDYKNYIFEIDRRNNQKEAFKKELEQFKK
jgi:uncharacterized protein YpmS